MTGNYLKKQLSARELEVLRLSSEGLTDKEIAQQLSVSLGTIHTYWTRIRAKCFGKTRAEIVSQHVRHQIMTEEIPNPGAALAERVLNSIPAIVMLFDSRFVLRFANDRVAAITTASRPELVGKQLDQLGLDADCMHALRKGMTQVLAGSPNIRLTDAKGFRCDFMNYEVDPGSRGILIIKIPPAGAELSNQEPQRAYAAR